MGKLLITAVPSQQVAQAAASPQATPLQATPEEPAPGVIATIQFGKNEYRFNIFGIALNDINHLSKLVPCLEVLLSNQRRKPMASEAARLFSTYPTDSEYKIARQLTFSTPESQVTSITIAGSGEALYNLLTRAIKYGKNDINTLICNNKDRWYYQGVIFNSGLEKLPNLVPKIQLAHVSNLTTLQFLVAPNSQTAFDMIANLLNRQCLPQLKVLHLQYSRGCNAKLRDKHYIMEKNYPHILHNLYHTLINQNQLPALEDLRLLLWCRQMNEIGLQVLQRLYPTLKNLAIDSITPMAKSVTKIEHSYGTNGYGQSTYYIDTWQKLKFPVNPSTFNRPMLAQFLREQAENNQLECLEIYDWQVTASQPLIDLQTLQTAITQGQLSKLNSIVIRPNADEFFAKTPSTSRDTWVDTKDLLNAVIEQNLPLVNLQLLMPEQNSYISWLEHIAAGRFPALKTLHYRLPDRFIQPGTLYKELEETHYPRVINSLTLIFNAIVERRAPELESVIFEGDLPEPFTHLVENIESALKQM